MGLKNAGAEPINRVSDVNAGLTKKTKAASPWL